MSTRRKGKPVLLREVLWAGKQPFTAYEWYFNSQGRRYRVVVPKPCSNFWIEPQPLPSLGVRCTLPQEARLDRPLRVCGQVENTGAGLETQASLTLALSEGGEFTNAEAADGMQAGETTWRIQNINAGERREHCASLVAKRRGPLGIRATIAGDLTPASTAGCETLVRGIPAVLFEVIDLNDPVRVGGEVNYVIKVLNQGTEPLSHIRLQGRLEDSQQFIAGSGATEVAGIEHSFNSAPLPMLDVGQEATWRVNVKAVEAGDVRLNVDLSMDQFERSVSESEATMQY